MDTVCTIHAIGQQLSPTDPGVLAKETQKGSILSTLIRFTTEGWPKDVRQKDDTIAIFQKVADSPITAKGCLLCGTRTAIPLSLHQVLQILHLGHFGIERMKKLARTAAY